jgi:hypothetical protein
MLGRGKLRAAEVAAQGSVDLANVENRRFGFGGAGDFRKAESDPVGYDA